jgi:hypothetical protein
MHHAQTLGLVAMNGQQPVPGPRAIQAPSLIKLDKETELCWVAAGERTFVWDADELAA